MRGGAAGGAGPSHAWVHAAALGVLAALTLWTRLCNMSTEFDGGALRLSDPDTVRRLVRVQHVFNPHDPYPYRDPNDGWYADPARRGTVLHWTLPMDGVIAALDPLLAPRYPGARRFEAGAAWAGPVLGVLAVALYYLLATSWLGTRPAFLVTLLFALSNPTISVGAFGNGDHTSLQLLATVGALGGTLAILAGHGGRAMAMLTGAAIGLGIWVSTETMVVWDVMALIAVVSLIPGSLEERRTLARRHVEWSTAALAVVALGVLLEHRALAWTLEWDLVSGFQLHQLLVLWLFAVLALALLPRLPRPPMAAPAVAAVAALVVGLAPLVLSAGYRAALAEQIGRASVVNRWAQSEVSEYRSLFSVEGFFVVDHAWERLTWLAFGLPVWLVAVVGDRRWRPALRIGLALAVIVSFGLTCYEMKLGHLFMAVYPIVLVVGGDRVLGRAAATLRVPATAVRFAGATAAVACFLLAAHPTLHARLGQALAQSLRSSLPPAAARSPDRLLLDALASLPLPDGPRRSVLADWPLGAFILYYTDKPVVASGYHRNLDGIRDAYRVLVARLPEDGGTLRRILDERGVRWIVTKNNAHIFARGTRGFPDLGEFARFETIQYRGYDRFSWRLAPYPADTKRTFLWQANVGGVLAEPLRLGHLVVRLHADVPAGSLERGELPIYTIYEVDETG